MDPRKPDCTNEKLANTAGCIATATKLAGAAAKGIGEALPAPIKAAGHVAKVAEAAMKDKTPGAGSSRLILAKPTVSFGYIRFASRKRTQVLPDFGYDTRKVSSGKTVKCLPA